MEHVRIEAERELADVARAWIGIENLVQLLGVVARRLHHFPVLEFQPDIVEPRSLINARRVESDVSLDGILYRTTKDFAVRNVAVAAADYGADALDAEAQFGARSPDLH